MGPKLKGLIASLGEDHNPYDLRDELQLVHGIHADMISIFEETQVFIDTLPVDDQSQRQIKQQARILANAMLNDSTERVLSAIERCARITSQICDKLHPQYIEGLSKQFLEMLYECFDNDRPEFQDGINKFEKMMDERLQLPTVAGSMPPIQAQALAEEAMLAMDLSVPGPPTLPLPNVDGVL